MVNIIAGFIFTKLLSHNRFKIHKENSLKYMLLKYIGIKKQNFLKSLRSANTKTLPCIWDKGSMTVEAAMVVPIFVFFLVLILGLFRVMKAELQMNQAISYTASVLAMESVDENSMIDKLYGKYVLVEQLKEQDYNSTYMKDGWQGMKLSSVRSDDQFVRIDVEYEICLPINIFGKQYVDVTQSAVARRWTGQCEESDSLNTWVYITPFGTAYHKSSSCSYLDLSVWAATKDQVPHLRNLDGGKYDPCLKCKASSENSSYEYTTVYVTDYGELYHVTLECGQLKRTVLRVAQKNVDRRTPCQKCYGEE